MENSCQINAYLFYLFIKFEHKLKQINSYLKIFKFMRLTFCLVNNKYNVIKKGMSDCNNKYFW